MHINDEWNIIRDQQKVTWNKSSAGWWKWNDFNMTVLKPMGDAIIDRLQVKESDQILDIATGTGEPGLSLARIAKSGKVTATDISEEMLSMATHLAASKGITNYQTILADCCELPFTSGYFDAVSCRMGFMFFPDLQLAADEMFRVIKPGGRMSTCVWGIPEKNPWITRMTAVLKKNIELPDTPEGKPGMFRCSNSDQMIHILEKAGFVQIQMSEISGFIDYGTPARFWEITSDVAAPVVNAMNRADELTKQKIRQDAQDIFNDSDGQAKLGYSANVFYARKE